jgi:hypothetical protein
VLSGERDRGQQRDGGCGQPQQDPVKFRETDHVVVLKDDNNSAVPREPPTRRRMLVRPVSPRHVCTP